MRLQIVHHLQLVFDIPQKPVGLSQLLLIVLAHEATAAEPVKRSDGFTIQDIGHRLADEHLNRLHQVPAIFVAAYPGLGALNIMGLASPSSAILSAVIFNALILVALVPLALRGVRYRPSTAAALLRRNLLIYGLGGLIVPFVGIKAIDLTLAALNLG